MTKIELETALIAAINRRRFNRTAVAHRCGISRQYLWMCMNGQTANPLGVLLDVAAELGIEVRVSIA